MGVLDEPGVLHEGLHAIEERVEALVRGQHVVRVQARTRERCERLHTVHDALCLHHRARTRDERGEAVLIEAQIHVGVTTDRRDELARQLPSVGQYTADLSVGEAEQLALGAVQTNALAHGVGTELLQHTRNKVPENEASTTPEKMQTRAGDCWATAISATPSPSRSPTRATAAPKPDPATPLTTLGHPLSSVVAPVPSQSSSTGFAA